MKTLEEKVSVVIVNFNAGEFLHKCLSSLVKSQMSLDIWVVDNASMDNSIDLAKKKFPNFHYILNKENLGFTKANNLALRKVQTEYILILNPDTEVLPETIPAMVDFMKNHLEVGAASCLVELSSGKIDLASHRGFPTPWAAFLYYGLGNDYLYHQTYKDMKRPHEVDSITGAFFMTRKTVLDKVGLFDEDYFMYAEDLDLCFRIKKAGYKIMYVPGVKVIHHKGISSGIKKHSKELTTANIEARKKALDNFYETMKIFYKKHLEKNYPFFINWLVHLGINLRWIVARRKLHV